MSRWSSPSASTRPAFREPQAFPVEPWRVAPEAEPWFDRLHFLTWANTYDARVGDVTSGGGPSRPPGSTTTAPRPRPTATPTSPCPTARRRGSTAAPACRHRAGLTVVHSDSVDLGALAVVPHDVTPGADLAPDQLAAVAHTGGPARVIAPAGSGKTRVLTERLRHLHLDRGYEPAAVLAVAYNKQAQLEMEARTTDFRPRVRTLNSLGLWVLAEHRGGSPPVVDEPEVRRLVDSLIPGKRQRRANTDPIGPYVEGLTSIRLGLTDPELVEASRDDVPGLAELFPGFRQQLARRGAVDFDEQIYGAVEVLLADGPFRRSMQRSCRHLLVDEFQDLTPAHVLLVRLLSLPALDVFGVGDDDQCIYGHAGADPAFLIDYERLFPGAVPHPLTVNYRCPVEVVDGARTLLGYNHRRVPKQIDPGPTSDSTAGALRIVEHGRDDGATALVSVRRRLAGRTGRRAVVGRRAGPRQLAAAGAPRRPPRGRRPGVVGAASRRARAHRHARRPRLPAHRRRRRCDGPGRHRRDPPPPDPWPAAVVPRPPAPPRPVVAVPARRARRPGAGQGRPEGVAAGRRPAGRRPMPVAPARPATSSRRCATTSVSARR